MKIHEVLDTVDNIADIWGSDKQEKMEELANKIIRSGSKIHARMIELLKIDLGIETKTTSQYAPAAKPAASTAKPAANTTQGQPATAAQTSPGV